jgi:hypothetical protein
LKVLGNFLTFAYRVTVRRVFFDVTGTPLPLTSASVDAANAIANFFTTLDPADTQYDAAFQSAMNAASSELNVVLNSLTPIALAAHQPSPVGGGPLRELFRCSASIGGHAYLAYSFNSIRTDLEFLRILGLGAALGESPPMNFAIQVDSRLLLLVQEWDTLGGTWSKGLIPLPNWIATPAPLNDTGSWYTFDPSEAAYLASMNVEPFVSLGW